MLAIDDQLFDVRRQLSELFEQKGDVTSAIEVWGELVDGLTERGDEVSRRDAIGLLRRILHSSWRHSRLSCSKDSTHSGCCS